MQPTHASIARGHAAQWTVQAWTQGGNVPSATISLAAAPTSLKPKYSVGCGSRDGTALCDLGAVDVKSAKRELQAQVAVPVTATTVTSVRLTATASAAHLPKKPKVSVTVKVTAPPPGAVVRASVGRPVLGTMPLSISELPFLPFLPGSTISQGGNVAGLFPTLTPGTDPPAGKPAGQKGSTTPVANTFALSQGASVVGGQVAGLGVLALGLVLAVTRLSVRRKRPARASAAESGKPAEGSAKPADGSAKAADGAQPASGESGEPQARTSEPPPAPTAESPQSADEDPKDQA
jgi:hypothetical protein